MFSPINFSGLLKRDLIISMTNILIKHDATAEKTMQEESRKFSL